MPIQKTSLKTLEYLKTVGQQPGLTAAELATLQKEDERTARNHLETLEESGEVDRRNGLYFLGEKAAAHWYQYMLQIGAEIKTLQAKFDAVTEGVLVYTPRPSSGQAQEESPGVTGSHSQETEEKYAE
ncbi:MAG: hypothetical protein JW737_00270 [Acidobacteria bacterium]|nr:hypothetical protein [Acidobacteriota bacterium]